MGASQPIRPRGARDRRSRSARTGPPGGRSLWAPLAGSLGTIGLVAFYRGMAAGAMSVVAPIAAVAAGFPSWSGSCKATGPGTLASSASALALGGCVLTSIERGGEQRRPRRRRGLGPARDARIRRVLRADARGGAPRLPLGGPRLPHHLVSLVWTIALLVRRTRLARDSSATCRARRALGVLDTGGNVLFAAASSAHGLLSVVSVLASLYPVVTVLIARIVLGERVQRLAGPRRLHAARRRRPDPRRAPAALDIVRNVP